MIKIQIVVGVITIFFLIIIIELIRHRKFEEKYALVWIFSMLSIGILSFSPKLLFIIADLLNMYYLTCFFLIASIFLLTILLFYSVNFSQLTQQNKKLAQEIGILRLKLSNLENIVKEKSISKNNGQRNHKDS